MSIRLSEIWNAIEGRVVALIHKTEARGCRVYRSTTQSINNNTLTALSFDTEVVDTDGCWAVGDPTKLYAQRDGYYAAGGCWEMLAAQNTVASRILVLVRVNGTTVVGIGDNHTIANKNAAAGCSVGMIWLAAGEYVEIMVLHDEGGAKNTAAATATNQHLCAGWLMRVG
jgi:hypothetical protein